MKLFKNYKLGDRVVYTVHADDQKLISSGIIEEINNNSLYPYLIKFDIPLVLHGYTSTYIKIKKSSINYFKSLFL